MSPINKLRLYVAAVSAVIGLISFESVYRSLMAFRREFPSPESPAVQASLKQLELNQLAEQEADIFGSTTNVAKQMIDEILTQKSYADFKDRVKTLISEVQKRTGSDRVTAAAEVLGMEVDDLRALVETGFDSYHQEVLGVMKEHPELTYLEAAAEYMGMPIEHLREIGFPGAQGLTSEETERAEAEAEQESEMDQYFHSLGEQPSFQDLAMDHVDLRPI